MATAPCRRAPPRGLPRGQLSSRDRDRLKAQGPEVHEFIRRLPRCQEMSGHRGRRSSGTSAPRPASCDGHDGGHAEDHWLQPQPIVDQQDAERMQRVQKHLPAAEHGPDADGQLQCRDEESGPPVRTAVGASLVGRACGWWTTWPWSAPPGPLWRDVAPAGMGRRSRGSGARPTSRRRCGRPASSVRGTCGPGHRERAGLNWLRRCCAQER
jgi:hypothetical protein